MSCYFIQLGEECFEYYILQQHYMFHIHDCFYVT